ncbi:alpha-N-arabinofuranosidase [Lentilactobacillus curieae]|uniref:non-reducing end alpha-L-arabinofuranosidase n=1 Tax=Lentilactobacillus curieae TaxID=1138822 RepID=A0A1S6QIJ6_9LACO|nr:alpha-L-arabinofuranosidase C-terminal domain-containing protein [Lentilactobacillus curieae]AQW21434.1 alpha-N-arabinofuranosidase [Lentilactobacillus curieae]
MFKFKIKNVTDVQLNDLYGIFFEDINHAADGGLYAEMVQNRSFEFEHVDNQAYKPLYSWKVSGTFHYSVESNDSLGSQNLHYLHVDSGSGPVTVTNFGFNDGMALTIQSQYDFSLFANPKQPFAIEVMLIDDENNEISQRETIQISKLRWQKYQCRLTANTTTSRGRLVLIIPKGQDVNLDMISLFPVDTFKHRKNGVRKDIAKVLLEMKPKFLRFPGGCLVHDGTLDKDDRDSMYRWKNSIGPVEHRPTRRNKWGYNQTLGLGFFEYFQFAEDIGAKPLPVLPGGYDPHHHRAAPINKLNEWVQDALDLIEFANGGTNTTWGCLRSEMGHPEPFNLEYLAIGNEEVGQEFFDRYPIFHKAIKEKYPDIKLINSSGPFASGKEFNRGWQSAVANGSDFVDEHFYMAPDWFYANYSRYDNYDSNGPKAFIGEYASKANRWENALAEAAFMTSLEKNANKVGLACYAPLLANIAYVNWSPDLIFFNQKEVCPSVNYYVQKAFMNFQGTNDVAYEVSGEQRNKVLKENKFGGTIGLEGDNADVEFYGATLTNYEDNLTYHLDSATISDKNHIDLFSIDSQSYGIKFKAKRIGGRSDKGFHLAFSKQGVNNQFQWILGGWENQDSIIRQLGSGNDQSEWDQCAWSMETNKEYQFEIQVRKRNVKTYIDGEIMNDIDISPSVIHSLYHNLVFDKNNKEYYLKLVNVTNDSFDVSLDDPIFVGAKIHELSGDPKSENLTGQENVLSQKEYEVDSLKVEVPKYSVIIVESQPQIDGSYKND